MIGMTARELGTTVAVLTTAGGVGVGSYYGSKAVLPDDPSTLGAIGAGAGGVGGLLAAVKTTMPGGMLGRGPFGASPGVKLAAVVAGPIIGALILGNVLD